MTRLLLSLCALAIAYHYAAPQRMYAADLWRDVQRVAIWPGVE